MVNVTTISVKISTGTAIILVTIINKLLLTIKCCFKNNIILYILQLSGSNYDKAISNLFGKTIQYNFFQKNRCCKLAAVQPPH